MPVGVITTNFVGSSACSIEVEYKDKLLFNIFVYWLSRCIRSCWSCVTIQKDCWHRRSHGRETLPASLHRGFVRGIHRSPMDCHQKRQECGTLMFSVLTAQPSCWINNRVAGWDAMTPMWHHYNYFFPLSEDVLALLMTLGQRFACCPQCARLGLRIAPLLEMPLSWWLSKNAYFLPISPRMLALLVPRLEYSGRIRSILSNAADDHRFVNHGVGYLE